MWPLLSVMTTQWPEPPTIMVQVSDCDLAETETSNPVASTAIQPSKANFDLFMFGLFNG
jgi:hypothetical protein